MLKFISATLDGVPSARHDHAAGCSPQQLQAVVLILCHTPRGGSVVSLTLQQHVVPPLAWACFLQWLPCRYMPVTMSRMQRRHEVVTTILLSRANRAAAVEKAGGRWLCSMFYQAAQSKIWVYGFLS